MCSGSKRKTTPTESSSFMEGNQQKEGFSPNCSPLLELAASDDVFGFKNSVEVEGCDVNEASLWYGRVVGSRKMGLEERSPLMIAAMFGSTDVLKFILSIGTVDVNQACGSDGATALHCAAAGGSKTSPEIVKFLLDNSADRDSVDAKGNKPGDLIAPGLRPSCVMRKKALDMMLKGNNGDNFIEGWLPSDDVVDQPEELQQLMETCQKEGSDKKEYPVDLTLPDIKNGIYGTDEFRMYTFKVKPCSRAYSHDWTECPFVHPGENARRRDPRKFHYSCVPCPEFRKGTCRQGDGCEYAHGVFECWLHPAQYRTRLCKDETGCNRRVCFFAHKPEELRPLYASTGSAVPSPRSSAVNLSPLDMSNMSPLALGSPSALMHSNSTPPMSPLAANSSPLGGGLWQNQSNVIPPTLQLPGSRLKTAMSARDMELEMELLGLSPYRHQQQQQHQHMMDEMLNLSSQASWNNTMATAAAMAASSGGRLGGVNPTNLEDVFGSLEHSMLSQLQGSSSQVNSPTGIQIRQNMNQQLQLQQQQQLRSSYPNNLSSSPVRSPSFGLESSAVAAMSSRSAAFAKQRSQSFIDRGAMNRHPGLMGSSAMSTSTFSDWGSPTGKLDWGVQGEELNKFRKSASFGFRTNNAAMCSPSETTASPARPGDEPDVSWVQSLVKDAPPQSGSSPNRRFSLEEQQIQMQKQYHLNSGGIDMLSPYMEQLYMEQEQMVA